MYSGRDEKWLREEKQRMENDLDSATHDLEHIQQEIRSHNQEKSPNNVSYDTCYSCGMVYALASKERHYTLHTMESKLKRDKEWFTKQIALINEKLAK